VYANERIRIAVSPVELVILSNVEEAEAQPAMIFNAILEYHT